MFKITKTMFRIIAGLGLALFIVAIYAVFLRETSLPPELLSFIETQIEQPLTVIELSGLFFALAAFYRKYRFTFFC